MTKLVVGGAANAANEGKLNSKGGRPAAEGAPVADAAAVAALAGAMKGVPQAKVGVGMSAAPAKAKLDAAKFVRPDEDDKDEKRHDDQQGEGETRHLAMVDEASAAGVGPQTTQVAQDADGGSSDSSDGGSDSTALYVGGGLLAAGAIIAVAASGGDDKAPANRAPAFAAATGTGTVAENAATTTVVFDANATDADTGDTTTYTLSGTDAAAFNINATTGEVTLKASADFETKPSYTFNVVATDKGGLTATQAVTLNVTNVNEATTITSNGGGATAALSIAENTTTVTTVTATDVDAGTTITYSIAGGADAALFNLDSKTGVLTFKSAPNFEAPADVGVNNVYDVTVRASDGTNNDDQAIAVTVTNLAEAPPVANDDTFNVTENTAQTLSVAANDTDADSPGGLTYSLVGAPVIPGFNFAADGTFSLNTNDAGYNSIATGATKSYNFTYQISDGTSTDTAVATIVVTGADDAPTFTSTVPSPLTFAEGTATSTVVYNADATDTDTVAALTYSLGGTDAGDFTIDAVTGEVRFAVSPDFEGAADTGADNTYNFNVIVSDGTSQTSQAVVLGVTNIDETVISADQDDDNQILTPAALNAGAGAITFTEDANTANTAVISNFSADDRILVSNAAPGNFNFNVSSTDTLDLVITYTSGGGAVNSITLDNVFAGLGTPPPNVAFSNSETSYEGYLGFNFFQFA